MEVLHSRCCGIDIREVWASPMWRWRVREFIGAPVWNLLEGQFDLLLANATHMRNVPGRKTDIKDCEWIAQLLKHGLLKPKFCAQYGVTRLAGTQPGSH